MNEDKRRVRLKTQADLSKISLAMACCLFISEKEGGKLLPSPPVFKLHVHQYAINLANQILREITPAAYPTFEVVPDVNLETEYDWYLGADGYPFIVGSWFGIVR